MQVMSRLLTLKEAAKVARRGEWTIRRWVKDRGLPANRPGGTGHYLIDSDDLEAFLRRHKIERPQSN